MEIVQWEQGYKGTAKLPGQYLDDPILLIYLRSNGDAKRL